ncbi:TetR/AcrR family transcriptional regulator [Streptomyces sp. NBC_01283]|uniref:ScbR family autoregulator-binding transcription factor n=1 Tax=Streptomyces sp. NBC_01283 TaxID=2903812 RepID=UPI00352FBB52|nr:TetR/AcrR family transcriptional regulator [Streptomyces sp. NBC_01283]WSL21320.1 TetR/AcrR family transcriptional regulator [Streptomyces sp. NBC_01283]
MAKQERAVRTRKALITAAAEVFSREGYRTASLTVISRLAGVSSGALHFHFPTKSALALAVEEAAADRLRVIVERCEKFEQPEGPIRLVVDASYQVVEQLAADPVLRAGFELGGHTVEMGSSGRVCDLWQRWVASVLEHAQGAGGLRSEVVPGHVAGLVVAVTAGLEELGRRDPRWLAHPTLTTFWRLVLPQVAPAGTSVPLQFAGS